MDVLFPKFYHRLTAMMFPEAEQTKYKCVELFLIHLAVAPLSLVMSQATKIADYLRA